MQKAGLSLPPRGAWIEIARGAAKDDQLPGSLPPRGAWIEIYTDPKDYGQP